MISCNICRQLRWNRISLTGDYLWSQVSTSNDGFRPLNIVEEAHNPRNVHDPAKVPYKKSQTLR
jgi:hypothetical protein